MRLTKRIDMLAERIPEQRRETKTVPTGSLTEFIRGLLAGTFRLTDLDRTNCEHTSMAALLNAVLVTLSPAHQEWCDANPWARAQQDGWEREHLSLTPAEMAALRALPGANRTCA